MPLAPNLDHSSASGTRQLPASFFEVARRHNIVALEHRPRFMAGDSYRNSLRNSGPHQIPNASAAQIMENPALVDQLRFRFGIRALPGFPQQRAGDWIGRLFHLAKAEFNTARVPDFSEVPDGIVLPLFVARKHTRGQPLMRFAAGR
jgi:hypothetical protein